MKPSIPWPFFLGILLVSISLVSSCALVQPAKKENAPGEDLLNELSALSKRLEEIKSRLSALEDRADRYDKSLGNLTQSVSSCQEQTAILSREIQNPAGEHQKSSLAHSGSSTASFVEPGVLYQEARELLLDQKYDAASRLFKEYATRYPDAELADNSIYWLGECYYSQGKFQDSITVFNDLVKRYPKGKKVPDALLKTAYAYLSLNDLNRGHHYLKLLVKQYPFTPAGEKAEEKLKLFQ